MASSPLSETATESAPDALRRALAGTRGFLLDFDGVLVLAGRPIPGASEALRELERRAVPYRVVTNTSMMSRATMARRAAARGVELPAERIFTALAASAAWTRRHLPGEALFVLGSDDARTEFAGQRLLTTEEAAAPDARAAAVVVGDSPEALSWENVNLAFRLLHRGARLLAMHRNQWWLTPDGPTIDSGAFVAGLEYATGRRAFVLGKPSAAFYGEAVADLSAELVARGERRPRRADLAMVGDDLGTDIGGGRRAGLRTVFVRSGKHGDADLADAIRRGRLLPHAVAASLAEVVAALD